MAFNHKYEQIIQDFIEGDFVHLLPANCQDLAPLRVFGVLDTHVIELILRYLVLSMTTRACVYALIDSIVLYPIDCFDCLIHLRQVLDDFNDNPVEIDI